MTATTTKLASVPASHLVDRLRRAASATLVIAAGLGARWQRWLAASQMGPSDETVIGRATGARI